MWKAGQYLRSAKKKELLPSFKGDTIGFQSLQAFGTFFVQ